LTGADSTDIFTAQLTVDANEARLNPAPGLGPGQTKATLQERRQGLAAITSIHKKRLRVSHQFWETPPREPKRRRIERVEENL
jgi:hypothetical protein